MDAKRHWEDIYTTKSSQDVSWYQLYPSQSMELISAIGLGPDARIIDVGGGASTFADALLAKGFQHISVLDISAAALAIAKKRLGDRAQGVQWLEANALEYDFTVHAYDLWHDRAVFHFLNSPAERARYIQKLKSALAPGGHVIIATFSTQGPRRCSGLDITQYEPETLQAELGQEFKLLHTARESHQTPSGNIQNFMYCVFGKL